MTHITGQPIRPLGVPVDPTYTDWQPAPRELAIEVSDTADEGRTWYCGEGPGHEWVWLTKYDSWICKGCAAYGAEIEE